MTMPDHSATQQHDAAAAASQPDVNANANANAGASAAAPGTGDDVMRILADVEGQLNRLRTAQKQQDDAIASLTTRSRSIRSAEEELEKTRLAIKQQAQQVERDQQRLQQERDEFTERCRLTDQEMRKRSSEVDELRRTLEQQRNELGAEHEQSKRGVAELEQAKSVWQQNRKQVEEQLQRSQAKIDQRLAECVRKQEEAAAANNQWEKHRQEAQAKLDERARQVEAQAAQCAQRESDMQKERQRLAALEQQHQQQREALERHGKVLEDDRAELLLRVEKAERNVGELIEQIERTQQELVDQTRLVKSAMEKVSGVQERERALEKALEAAKQHAAKVEHESQELLRLADTERNELEGRQQKALLETQEARDAAMAELEIARNKVIAIQRELQGRDEELARKEQRLVDSLKKLDMAGKKLAEFAQILSEQTPQLERGAAALAMVEEQAEQIDRLTKQLAELQLSSDPEEIRRRDQRINELTNALREARGQTADEAGVAEIEQRNAQLEQEVARLRLESQNAQIAAEEARHQLQAYVDSGAEHQVKDVALAEHAAKVAALTAEIERANAVAARDVEEKLAAQSKRHQQELAEARSAEQVAGKLRQKIADLEAQLAKSKAERAAVESTSSGDGSEQAEYLNRLRAKAEQITSVADHLRRRRARLEKVRRLIRQKHQQMPSAGAAGSAQMRVEQLGQIERERQHLLEVRKMLASSEYTMIRRWARQRAAYTLASLALIAVFCAGASWLVVNHFFPPVRSASVVLEARSRPDMGPLSQQQKQAWSEWHGEIVRDAAFQQTLAKRMAERKLERWSRTESVAHRVGKELAVDDQQPGVVMYTLAGTDADEMTSFLDVLTGAVLTESNRESSQRSDNANAVATGERRDEGRVRYASINPVPVKDERLSRGLPIFGIAFGVLLALMVALYIKFMRSKRVFDEENAALFTEGAVPG